MNNALATTKSAFHILYPTAPQLDEQYYQNILDWFNGKKWEDEFDEGTYDHLTAPDAMWIFWQMYRIVDHPLWEALEDDCDWEPDHDALNEIAKRNGVGSDTTP